MFRISLIIILSLNSLLLSSDYDVSIDEVNIVVNNFINAKSDIEEKYLIEEIFLLSDYVYLIDLNPNGYILLSKSKKSIPILGYSFDFNFNKNDIPIQLNQILNSYNQSIQFLYDNNIDPDNNSLLLWNNYLSNSLISENDIRDISPLITANWNQGGSWNDMCPGNSLVGCVAVAMGQVMYYWGNPLEGNGYSQYYDQQHGIISVNFEDYQYNFDNMQDDNPTYDSQLLLYHAGVAVNMDYNPWGSGASVCWDGPSAQHALDYHFSYNDDITCVPKINYSDIEWETLIKDQLDRGWPVVYRGYSEDAGHAWNMDGYQNNYYHCNWGWGGSANGYFYFDNLNGGGYNFIDNQAALINIYPENISIPVSLFEYNVQDLTVSFNDLSDIINEDQIILWEWDFGDGSQSNLSSPQHIYNNYGLYMVELVVMSEFGLYSAVHFENINIINQLYDINNDNNIDVLDVVELISVILDNAFNEYIEEYDINLDFQVNILDVIILVQSIIN